MKKDDLASDGFVHIRSRPSAPGIDPALCGRRGQSTVTSASAYWGPGGDGYRDMCPACVAKEKGGRT